MTPQSSVNPFAREAPPRGLWRWIPGVLVLRNYKREWLTKDITAGVVLTAILVPVGMGYAEAAGIPAIYGLYATIVPLLAYALFGPSHILVLGPDSSLAALIAATVLPLAGGDAGHAVTLAGMLAILSGLLCILAGIAKFGFITDLLSKPIRYGYLNGIALTVLIGQLPKIVGFSVEGDNLLQEAINLGRGIFAGQVNGTALIIGVVCLAIILGFKRWQPKVPGVLVAVVGATLAAAVFDLANRAGIAVVGPLPRGLPVPAIPTVSFEAFRALFAGALAIALVSFADMSVLSRTFALRCGYEVDGDQELIALGISNVAAGFFQGFSITSSSSRTPVAEAAGAKTQLTGVVGAVCIAVLLLVAPTLLQTLPHAALGAIVISACLGLFEIPGLLRLYHLRRVEFVLSLVCFLGVALMGVIQGIFLAVGLALLAFVWRAWRPYHAVLGMVDELQSYHDIVRHPEGRLVPGLVLFRWNAPLFFANAEIFHEHVLQAVAEAPTPTKWVVVTAEPVTDIDLTAADVLSELDQALQQEGIELCFAEMKGPVKDCLKKYGLFTRLGVENFYPTIEQAVAQYLKVHSVEYNHGNSPGVTR
ncbi:MAG TPA: SulP family inorganic anion transporter [Anaerolineae bacterium]|nr:SulP family inorganic anion transporter [Anaerolineae bacterium]